jgi:hypothetical protein
MHDLNDLIDRRDPMARQVSFGGASMSSFDGPYINERGEIAVLGIDRRTGLQHAYPPRRKAMPAGTAMLESMVFPSMTQDPGENT